MMKNILFILLLLISISITLIGSWTRQSENRHVLSDHGSYNSVQTVDKAAKGSTVLPVKKIQSKDITWWDLLSKSEFVYYQEQDKKYMTDSDYKGDGSVAPAPGINPEMEGQVIRIPGFTVGVDSVPGVYNEMKSFLLVPYQGACIHVPPPPPNQTIYVEMDEPVKTDPYMPVYLEGTLHIEKSENDMAAYYYKMEGLRVSAYTE